MSAHLKKRPSRSAQFWLIDDNASDILLTQMILDDEDVEVALFPIHGGTAAMKHIEGMESAPFPDAILMDLNMPDVNGVDVLKAIRFSEKLQHVPVFVLSGSDADSDRRIARALGATDYVTKPLSREKIEYIAAHAEGLKTVYSSDTCYVVVPASDMSLQPA